MSAEVTLSLLLISFITQNNDKTEFKLQNQPQYFENQQNKHCVIY